MSGYTEVLSPAAAASAAALTLAPGLATLRGKTVGVLSNQKVNADEVLDGLTAQLEARFGIREVVKRVKRIQSQGAPAPTLDELAKQCDVVITGVGD
jgi:hypothetical protein